MLILAVFVAMLTQKAPYTRSECQHGKNNYYLCAMNSVPHTSNRLYEVPQCLPISISGRDSILLDLSNYGDAGDPGAGFGGASGVDIIVGGDF